MSPRDLPAAVTNRRAVVYVRQSTGVQVVENLESQRQQYELADLAREYGFREVVVVDADLGVSATEVAAEILRRRPKPHPRRHTNERNTPGVSRDGE